MAPFFVSASSKSNLLKQESTTKFPAQGSFLDAGMPRAASRTLFFVSLLGWLTMEARMHLMVNTDRQPICVFASHFAKEIAHGQPKENQSQRAVFYSPGSEGGNHHHEGIWRGTTDVVEDREPEGPDHPDPSHQGAVRGLHAAGVEGR